jgi:hypothetical protein
VVAARAPGHRPWSAEIVVDRSDVVVSVPPLPLVPRPAAAITPALARPESPRPSRPTWRTAAGTAALLVGLGAGAAGVYFGWRAREAGREVTTACRIQCDATTVRRLQEAGQRDERLQWGLLATGALGATAGALVLWTGGRF